MSDEITNEERYELEAADLRVQLANAQAALIAHRLEAKYGAFVGLKGNKLVRPPQPLESVPVDEARR
jgi:hypothetical protein